VLGAVSKMNVIPPSGNIRPKPLELYAVPMALKGGGEP